MSTARPGAIGLSPIHGIGGFGIQLGELILDRRDSAQHAFILLDDGTVLEAEPKGARIAPLAHCAKPIAWIDPPLSDATRAAIVRIARSHVGCGYSWWAYAWLALEKFGLRPAWVKRKVDNPGNAMCSQLVDRIWREAAKELAPSDPDQRLLHLFADGRDPGTVTPGDLAWIAATKPWEIRP